MSLPPSAWIRRFAHLIPSGATVLDVACGGGRHSLFFAQRGCQVTAIDRDAPSRPLHPAITQIQIDLEDGSPWPLPGRVFDAVIVTHYLWRPLFPALCDAVAPGGVMLYETFAQGNQVFGRPRSPDFLLERGELLHLTAPLMPVAFEDGIVDNQAVMQRICAMNGAGPAALPDS